LKLNQQYKESAARCCFENLRNGQIESQTRCVNLQRRALPLHNSVNSFKTKSLPTHDILNILNKMMAHFRNLGIV